MASIVTAAWYPELRSMKLAPYLHCAVCTLATIALSSCGVPGLPQPPSLNLPEAPTDLRGLRKGDKVFLVWTVPAETTDHSRVRSLGSTQICRSTDESRKDCTNPVGTVPPPAAQQKKSATPKPNLQAGYIDQLTPSILSNDSAEQFSYSVSVLNPRGRGAGLSNKVAVPAVFALSPPSDFHAEVTADGILLIWTGNPQSTETPELHHVYRVNRREQGTKADTVAGEMPVGSQRTYLLLDHSFEWEKTYDYRVTGVTIIDVKGRPETQFEGEDTPSVQVFAHDIFPPAVPAGLQAVYSGEGQRSFIDLIWTPDSEPDLAGYNIYRHEAGAAEQKLNTEPGRTPAFRDTNVAAGHAYFYSVSAIDVRGNESAHSAEASESVP